MDSRSGHLNGNAEKAGPFRNLYALLARRAYSAIMWGALFCTLTVKFFQSCRTEMIDQYFGWIYADVAFLLGVEVALAIACFLRPRKWVIRTVLIIAAVVCTWSVMNAGLVMRTGRQILPSVMMPLIHDTFSALRLIGVNLAKMPVVAVVLLGPSAIALTFLFMVLAKPARPAYNPRRFKLRVLGCLIIVLFALLARVTTARVRSREAFAEGISYNCHLKAMSFFFVPHVGLLRRSDLNNAERIIPTIDQVEISWSNESRHVNHNIVMVVLEGVQFKYTSLYDRTTNLTPYLASLADAGAVFPNTRSAQCHTTKSLFTILTGRFPSPSHDVVETVPTDKPYASLATILEQKLNFRTAYFQSAKGTFESRPGMIYSLGYDEFWSRDDLSDPNAFVGYLGSDEFKMLQPIAEWIRTDNSPFLVTILCSITHDPYEVPEWFVEKLPDWLRDDSREPVRRYQQSIYYTDKFIEALDAELAALGVKDNTILCIVSDHGEAFGEHGMLGHERIGFDEIYHIPWVIRAESLVAPGTRVPSALSNLDVTPTLLSLLGFDTTTAGFDGIDALGEIPVDRKVHFCDWKHEGPSGYVMGNFKYMYNPTNKRFSVFDLSNDPLEVNRIEFSEELEQEIVDEIIAWRKKMVFRPAQKEPTGRRMLFGKWQSQWKERGSTSKYRPDATN